MPIVNGSYVAPTWVNDAPPAIDADELNAISQTAERILLPKITITTEDSYTSMTATNGTDTITLTNNSGTWTGWFTDYGTWTVTAEGSTGSGVATVEVDTVKEYTAVLISAPADINDASWDEISTLAQFGAAGNFWAVGDTKSISLNGTVGTLSLNNLSIQAFILGFDHNSAVEGTGITFGGFKFLGSTNNIALVDSYYGGTKNDGTLAFNIEHWGYHNYGGWKGCDLRYDILGSTNVAPSGYGANAVQGRTGYDPSSYDIVNSPKSGTLLATFPADLRSVMKPVTKWTDNVAGGTGSVETNVTSSVEYLTLLSCFEVFGTNGSANAYESTKQQQYSYYIAGNSKRFYKHSETSSSCTWWVRSPNAIYEFYYCYVTGSSLASNTSNESFGLAPIFLV